MCVLPEPAGQIAFDPAVPDTQFLIPCANYRTNSVIAKFRSPEDLVIIKVAGYFGEGEVFHGILSVTPFESLTSNRLRESTLALARLP